MRGRLIKATLDALQEYGYHGASITRILQKAGVSSGAWSHHFKSKNELVAAAAGNMLMEAVEAGRVGIKSLLKERGADEIFRVLLDFLWEYFMQGKRSAVWIEVYMTCRTNSDLNKFMEPVMRKYQDSLDGLWREFFEITDGSDTPVERILNLTLFMTRGMAIQSIVTDDPVYYKTFRNQWVNLVKNTIKVKVPEQ